MKSTILSICLIVLQIIALSGCIFQHAGPDPKVPQSYRTPDSVPSNPTGRLIKVESEQLLDARGTHRHQEYNYDERGRLLSIYAPEDYLPCVSDIPYTWLLFTHGDVIEERYEYDDQDRLIRVTGYLPAEMTDDPLSYDITFTYDALGHAKQETLISSSGQSSISLEYDGELVSRVDSSDGRFAELSYENGELVRVVLPDGEITYSREPGDVLQPIESGVKIIDGLIENVTCSGPRTYTEELHYTMDGRLLYRSRDYEDDPQNTYYWFYYYSGE